MINFWFEVRNFNNLFIKWGRIGVIVINEVCVDLEEERLYDERKICRLIMIEKYLVLFNNCILSYWKILMCIW